MNAPQSVVDLARRLIAIPSVNPAGLEGSEGSGEAEVAEFLSEFLTLMGASVELIEVLPGRPNVIGRFPTRGTGKPRLAFAPHTDTVGVGGMSISPFAGEIRDGRLYGRGACDTKGPMAAQLWALWEMRDELADLSHEIVFLGLMDEEAGQAGSLAAAETVGLDFVIVAEPTEMEIVYTHKGSLWLDVTTRGTAAHSSRPELGDNAIYKMGRVIQCIADRMVPRLSGLVHSVLGAPTISIGVVRGGRKINVVPDLCQIEVDVRTIPSMDDFLDELRAELHQTGILAEIDVQKSSPALDTDPAHPLIGLLKQSGAQIVGAPWFCDAAMFAAVGIPAIAMGPGSIEQAHTADEFIEVSALEDGVKKFGDFLRLLR